MVLFHGIKTFLVEDLVEIPVKPGLNGLKASYAPGSTQLKHPGPKLIQVKIQKDDFRANFLQ